jgi:alkylation response protein AidB-like acyl-CoA dehydrogenase
MTTAVRLRPTDEQEELRDAVRRFLAQHGPISSVRSVIDTELGYDPDVWRRLNAELGVSGIAISEQRGGAGFGISELAMVMEECGAVLLPAPLLSSAVMCGLVLDAVGDTMVLPRLVTGDVVAALVHEHAVTVTDGAAYGSSVGVLDGMRADVFVIIADDGVYTVDAAANGVSRAALVTMDLTRRQAGVEFSGARAERIGTTERAAAGLDRATVALAAEQLGVLRRSVEMAVAYAKEREQFGRKIGSFQAVKHGLADMYASYELAVGAVAYAAWAADNAPDELPVAASVARAYLSPQSFDATFQMIQYHGGIGFTWEHDAHLYYKRAKTNETLLGDTRTHLERIAAHLLDGSVR